MPNTFNAEGKNFLEIAIAGAHAATVHSGIEKTMKALTDKYECQFFCRLVREYVGSCDICLRTQYPHRGPIAYVTLLHIPVRPWRDITVDFLKLSPVFTKCSLLHTNIHVGEYHIGCISRL